MDHTLIVTTANLEEYANRRDSQGVIPELIYRLVKQSIPELAICRIPYGDNVNQPGWDGLVLSKEAFLEFVPKGSSYWEIGTGGDPQKKATDDFRKRTEAMAEIERARSTFIFVTPRSAGSSGWEEKKQTEWLARRADRGWNDIRILDGVKLTDWFREFPAIGRWLAKKIGLTSGLNGISTAKDHWEMIQAQIGSDDPAIPPDVFIAGRENACIALQGLFEGKTQRLLFFAESPKDVEDFIAAFLASLDKSTSQSYCNRCLFISEKDAWHSVVETRQTHILVAAPSLGLDADNADLQIAATRRGHAVVIPVCGAWSGDRHDIIKLKSPSKSQLEKIFEDAGYPTVRRKELAAVGANRLSALRRYYLGLGGLPPYATWENARLIAQAGLFGKWDGNNPADVDVLSGLLGKPYGEWIEIVRHEVLRADTPLIQRDGKWRMVARGEAWHALGPRITDNDLENLKQAILTVLGERDPKLDLAKEERYAASIYGKQLQHSTLLREGFAETLALIGSNSEALSSCSQGKAEDTAVLTVRTLLDNADWERWVALEYLLPLIAEAAPCEFLNCVETALENIDESPFHHVFAQEGDGMLGGGTYISGLLWALETLAWHPDYLARVVLILGDLGSIDPGGKWSNRPSNSLADILLPWHFQTCASVGKRTSAVMTLLREQPEMGWKLLKRLLPHSHTITTGCHQPTWRNLISADWDGVVTTREYWDQVTIYSGMALEIAKTSFDRLGELIGQIADLPNSIRQKLLSHIASGSVANLPEKQRLPLYETLDRLARRHRKYAEANWSMPEDMVLAIEKTAESLAPVSPELRHRRLFSGNDMDLYESKGDYEGQRERLDNLRISALQELLDSGGFEAVVAFAKTVSTPYQVGCSLGYIASDLFVSELIPKYLQSNDEVMKNVISGYVLGKYFKLSWSWVDEFLHKDLSSAQKCELLLILPFVEEVWTRAEKHLGEEEIQYWQRAVVDPYGLHQNYTIAIKKLIRSGRPAAAVICLGRPGGEKAFDSSLALMALLEMIKQDSPSVELDKEAIVEVIKRLQKCKNVDYEFLFKIEWNFLSFLDEFSSGAPKTLENRLASDPTFYCEVLSLVFRSENEKETKPTEQQQLLARQAYQLLDGWKTPPGSTFGGTFNSDSFSAWFSEMKSNAKVSGYLKVALMQLGHVLTYAPRDEDGLWIHHAIAKELNAKDARSMRNGYTTKLFNQRGVYGFSAGKGELEIAKSNYEKADVLDLNGYSRFAITMRDFAKRYERDAEREAARDPYGDL